MTEIEPAPDLERIAMELLRQQFPSRLSTKTVDGKSVFRVADAEAQPESMRDFLRQHDYFVRVGMIPGRTTRNQISAALDMDVFALTRAAARGLAFEIDAFLLGQRLARVASGPLTGASLDTVFSQLSPNTVPWADASVRRFYSSYAVTARR